MGSRRMSLLPLMNMVREAVVIPLFVRDGTSFLNVEPLSVEEIEAHECPRVDLTNQHLTWQLHSTVFEDQGNDMVDHNGHVVQPMSKYVEEVTYGNNSVTAFTPALMILLI